jgi:hypothetical protein
MSRTYNLRTRAGTGVATQSGQVQEESLYRSAEIDNWSSEVAPHTVGPVPNAEADSAVLRTYSDVVASRPPSVYRERPSLPSGGP